MRTSELTGAALDWAVAKCEGIELENGCYNRLLVDGRMSKGQSMLVPFKPSADWQQGGAIIEREEIGVTKPVGSLAWVATMQYQNDDYDLIYQAEEQGTTPLVAAMRCYVASCLGDEVQLPEELK